MLTYSELINLRDKLVSGEIGLEFAANTLIKKAGSEGNVRFYVSASYLNSFKQFDYVNIKHMQDGHDHTEDNSRDLNTTLFSQTLTL